MLLSTYKISPSSPFVHDVAESRNRFEINVQFHKVLPKIATAGNPEKQLQLNCFIYMGLLGVIFKLLSAKANEIVPFQNCRRILRNTIGENATGNLVSVPDARAQVGAEARARIGRGRKRLSVFC